MVILKNQILSSKKNERNINESITRLSNRIADRFERIESRIDELEISSELHGWLFSLRGRRYDIEYPNIYLRIFRVVNDFYSIKSDNWSYNDIKSIYEALYLVGVSPDKKVSLNSFIDSIVEEIGETDIDKYCKSIYKLNNINIDYSNFSIKNISSPIFISIHYLIIQYENKANEAEALRIIINDNTTEALKILLKNSIKNLYINLNYEFTLEEAAVEILLCFRLVNNLMNKEEEIVNIETKQPKIDSKPDTDVKDKAMLSAAKIGNVAEVHRLLQAGADINAKDKDGWTSLIFASYFGCTGLVKILLDAGADPTLPTKCGKTALDYATQQQHGGVIVKMLLDATQIRQASNVKCNSIHDAAKTGNVAEVQRLLQAGADINATNNFGWTSLMLASYFGRTKVVKLLLDAGANVNAKDGYGWTALMRAAQEGYTEVAKILIEAGATVDAKNKYVKTALMYASSAGHSQVVELLYLAKSNIYARDMYGSTALFLASHSGHIEIVSFLIEAGADVDSKDKNQRTPLMEASAYGNVETVKVLIEAGADVNSKDKNQRTPLMEASTYGNVETVKVLIEAGADVKAKDKNGKTAYSLAYEHNAKKDIINLLNQHLSLFDILFS